MLHEDADLFACLTGARTCCAGGRDLEVDGFVVGGLGHVSDARRDVIKEAELSVGAVKYEVCMTGRFEVAIEREGVDGPCYGMVL